MGQTSVALKPGRASPYRMIERQACRALRVRAAESNKRIYVAVWRTESRRELTDYSRPVSWLPGANDNKFRSKLELYTQSADSVWIINELDRMVFERDRRNVNSSPQEYQRALLTAARTYAMYHVQRGTKHADEKYTVMRSMIRCIADTARSAQSECRCSRRGDARTNRYLSRQAGAHPIIRGQTAVRGRGPRCGEAVRMHGSCPFPCRGTTDVRSGATALASR